jgi:hypothetical protein
VDLWFDSRALQQLCNRRMAMAERLGDASASALAQCLQELDAADTLATAAALPHLAVTNHDRDGHVVVADRAGNQILLRLDEAESEPSSGESWDDATAATITQIVNGNVRLGA